MKEETVEHRILGFLGIVALYVGILIFVLVLGLVLISISPTLGPLVMVLLILGYVGAGAARFPILFSMAVRNVNRRRQNTLIVVLGLMIGTTIITSSLVVGDTLENLFTKDVYESYDETDGILFTYDSTGGYAFFDEQGYRDLTTFIENDTFLSNNVEDASPEISYSISVFDLDTQLSQADVNLIGFDHSESQIFGKLDTRNGPDLSDEDLGATEIALNEALADEIDAAKGDRIQVFYRENQSAVYIVKAVVRDSGRAAYGTDSADKGLNLFMPLDRAQTLLGQEGKINLIKVSNVGDKRDGMDLSEDVEMVLDPYGKEQDPILIFSPAKQDAYDRAVESSSGFQSIFFVMGTFSIIAGVMLIINIFVLLAEERKSEMGMARAIGMNRKQLTNLFLFEGTIYALIASGIGTMIGLVVAYIIMASFGSIIGGGSAALEAFTFTGSSLIAGFVGGMVITFITIFIASRKVSSLNIIRAIRNIPEPRYVRRTAPTLECSTTVVRCIRDFIRDVIISQYELFIMGLGTLMVIASLVDIGILYNSEFAGYGGLSIAVYGLGLFLRRYISDERAFTIAGSIVFLLWAIPIDIFDVLFGKALEGGIENFIFTGVFLVSSSLLVIMYNSDLILKALLKGCTFCRFGSIAPVFKTAISYPLNNRFRTGLTIAIFALIVFTVITSSMLSALLQGNIDLQVEEESGGYDLIAYSNPNTPITDFQTRIDENGNFSSDDFDTVVPIFTAYVSMQQMLDTGDPAMNQQNLNELETQPFSEFQEDGVWYNLMGASDRFLEESDFQLETWDEDAYETEEDAWNALKNNGSLAIGDPTMTEFAWGGGGGPDAESEILIEVGDYLVVRDNITGYTHTVKVIGFVKSGLVPGLFVRSNIVTGQDGFATNSSYISLVRFKGGTSESKQDRLGKDLEREFLGNGMQTVLIKEEIEERLSFFTNFVVLIQAFLSLGLIVGIAGLGVITIRSVAERKQQIGMLRAIGFNRKMVTTMFLIESSYVGLIGIILGMVLGFILGINFYLDPALDFQGGLPVPWKAFIIVFVVAYGATLLSTIGPSRSASKISPAEALRYIG
jgi:putative ABC transport system permease protein